MGLFLELSTVFLKRDQFSTLVLQKQNLKVSSVNSVKRIKNDPEYLKALFLRPCSVVLPAKILP